MRQIKNKVVAFTITFMDDNSFAQPMKTGLQNLTIEATYFSY